MVAEWDMSQRRDSLVEGRGGQSLIGSGQSSLLGRLSTCRFVQAGCSRRMHRGPWDITHRWGIPCSSRQSHSLRRRPRGERAERLSRGMGSLPRGIRPLSSVGGPDGAAPSAGTGDGGAEPN